MFKEGHENIHAEMDALKKLEKRDGCYAVVVVARKTMIGLSRPCRKCQYGLMMGLNVKRIYMVYHVNGFILVEGLK